MVLQIAGNVDAGRDELSPGKQPNSEYKNRKSSGVA